MHPYISNRVMAAERESNIELLRIVSMLMVVLVHIDGASLGLRRFYRRVQN